MVDDEFTVELLQGRPGQAVLGQQVGRHIGQGGVLHVGRNTEVALLGICKRKPRQVALELELDPGGGARQHRTTHVVAHLFVQLQRQVAVHPCAFGACKAALQVQHTGSVGGGLPLEQQLPLGIGIGKTYIAARHREGLALALPDHIAPQLLEEYRPVFQNAVGVDHAFVQHQLDLAAHLVQVKVHVQPLKARARRVTGLGGNGELADPPFEGVSFRLFQGPAPVAVQLLHQSARAQLFQPGVQRIPQRQALGNRTHGSQVQPVGHHFAAGRGAAFGIPAAQQHVATRPAQAVLGFKLQGLGEHFGPTVQTLRAHPARHRAQRQSRQVRTRGELHTSHLHIGRSPGGQPLLHIDPGAQGAPSLRQVHTQVYITAQMRQVHLRKTGVELAIPALPVARTA